MSNDLGLGNVDYGALATSGIDSFVTVLLWVLAIVLVGAVIGLGIWLLSFKHKVRVRKIIQGRTVVIDDRAREFKDRDGAIWWSFLKTKIKMTAPPEKAMDIGKRGKLVAEGYLFKDDKFVWREDLVREEDVDLELKSVKGDYRLFTSQERALFAKELRESETYKKKKLSEMLVAVAPYLAIMFIFVVFLIFFNEAVAPAVELGNSIKASLETQREIMQIVQNIVQNKESLMLKNVTIPN